MRRDAYFDNLKSVLIMLVVIGHFLLPMDNTRFKNSILYTIYLFHMPMFAMISGYFAKGLYRDGKFRTDRLVRIVWLYFIFKLAVHVTENLAAGVPVTDPIDFFSDSGAPWYLMALFWWYLSIPAAVQMKPSAVLAVTTALGLLSGYQDSLGDGLAMCRTLCFAPFFYAGYYLQREQVTRFLSDRRRWCWTAAALASAALIALGISGFLKPYLTDFKGMNYRRYAPELYAWGGVIRLVHYLAAAVMILGLMAATPSRRLPWTRLGERTLQIYILHRLLRDMMEYWGYYEVFASQYRRNVVFTVLLALLATCVLGNEWFARAFNRLAGLPDRWKLYRRDG